MLRQSGAFRSNETLVDRVMDSNELERERGITKPGEDLRPPFDAILSTIPKPGGAEENPLQILVANLDYSDYLGRMAIARVFNGTLRNGEDVGIAKLDGSLQKVKITKLFSFSGLKRVDIDRAEL